jgi:organic hydroperoxide reductase OsmC/OhrA
MESVRASTGPRAGTAVAVLEKGSPVPRFTSITLRVEMVVAQSDVERARRLLQTTEQRCIISHALSVPVTLEPIVRSP